MDDIVLQERDLDVLRSLSQAVRLLTLGQMAKLRGADVPNTKKRMAKLRPFVAAIRIFAQAPPDVSKSLCVWCPGQHILNWGELSHAAKKRYRTITPRTMTAYVATNRTLELFGITAKRGSADKPAVGRRVVDVLSDGDQTNVVLTQDGERLEHHLEVT